MGRGVGGQRVSRMGKGVGRERMPGWRGKEKGGDRMKCQNETPLFSF